MEPGFCVTIFKNLASIKFFKFRAINLQIIFLIAISSASRIQTSTKIKLRDISKMEEKIEIRSCMWSAVAVAAMCTDEPPASDYNISKMEIGFSIAATPQKRPGTTINHVSSFVMRWSGWK
nr:unnamed protein product [Callosobruchus analis]